MVLRAADLLRDTLTASVGALMLGVLFWPATPEGFAPVATAAAATMLLLAGVDRATRAFAGRALLAAYLTLVVVSAVVSAHHATLAEVPQIMSFALAAIAAAAATISERHRRLLIGVVGFGTIALGTVALVESLALQPQAEAGFRHLYIWTGFWTGYPELALISSIGAAIVFGICVSSEARLVRAAAVGVLAPSLLFIALSYSRAAWIALCLSAVWAAVVLGRRYRRPRLVLWMAAALVPFVLWAATARLMLPTENVPLVSLASFRIALGARVAIWRDTLRMIADAPLLGSGPGTYHDVFRSVYAPTAIGYHAHNMFLHVAAETGLPAAVCFGWLWWLALRETYRRAVTGDASGLALHFAIVVFVSRSLFDQFLSGLASSARLGLVAFTLLGLALGERTEEAARAENNTPQRDAEGQRTQKT